ncbi:sialic acid-binding Ig-like lectin 14 isoform X2 [Mirounga leonina]|uniref:sialic acid-binding Ig-like lectin 14 isoform X2 n=1 Tax=Mirounga leonina TaxID=9715 RepID=UPI00156C3CB5|nr:sialic acid-binding Ig-like lectin 14 isoform X2 [Mirounga leonina]
MGPLLLLSLLWGGSLQEDPGFELRVQDSVTVQEGLCVHVPCSFSYPWSSWYSREKPYMYWSRNGDSRYPVATNDQRKMVMIEARGRFHLIGNPWDNNCSLRIREARKSDQGVYKFRMERDNVKYNYRDKKLMVQVAALTQKPDIHFPEPLKSGYPTNLTCSMLGSCEEGRPLTFSWVGDALDSLDPQTLHSSVLTLTPRLQDHGSNLTCQVHLPGQDTVERTIRLNVSYAPQKLNISIFFSNVAVPKILQNTSSVLILEGQALGLLCAAESSPPAELSWFRGYPPWNATLIYRSANLDLPQVGAAEEGYLTCQAQNPLGSQHISLHLSVLWKSVFLAGALPAALGGAGAGALLSLSLCLIFFCIVKARRKQASRSREGLGNEDPVMGTVAWDSRRKPRPDSPPAQVTPVRDAPPSGDEQELHYASFSFHEMKSREPEDKEATSTSE